MLTVVPPLGPILAGNVNASHGPVNDVLFVNGVPGSGSARQVNVAFDQPFEIRMVAPPSRPLGPSAFALYLWRGVPVPTSVTTLSYGLGVMAMPPPLVFPRQPQPLGLANNIGRSNLLGAEHWPGPRPHPAPSVVVSVSRGVGVRGSFFLQGLIIDSASPSGRLAVTNGIELIAQ